MMNARGMVISDYLKNPDALKLPNVVTLFKRTLLRGMNQELVR